MHKRREEQRLGLTVGFIVLIDGLTAAHALAVSIDRLVQYWRAITKCVKLFFELFLVGYDNTKLGLMISGLLQPLVCKSTTHGTENALRVFIMRIASFSNFEISPIG